MLTRGVFHKECSVGHKYETEIHHNVCRIYPTKASLILKQAPKHFEAYVPFWHELKKYLEKEIGL
jgi:hypothetical protein